MGGERKPDPAVLIAIPIDFLSHLATALEKVVHDDGNLMSPTSLWRLQNLARAAKTCAAKIDDAVSQEHRD
jgi:hypothetical protein